VFQVIILSPDKVIILSRSIIYVIYVVIMYIFVKT